MKSIYISVPVSVSSSSSSAAAAAAAAAVLATQIEVGNLGAKPRRVSSETAIMFWFQH